MAGRPILEWQIHWLKHYGFTDIVLCVGYLWEKIREALGNGERLGVRISYSVEPEPLGTGGALMNARDQLEHSERFVVVNGDVLTNLDPGKVASSLYNFAGAIALVPLPSPFGIVNFDEKSHAIRSFTEKPRIRDYWINGGVYVFTREVFRYLPTRGDIERTSFPKMAEEGRLRAALFPEAFWMSIDSHKDLEEASKVIGEVHPFNLAR